MPKIALPTENGNVFVSCEVVDERTFLVIRSKSDPEVPVVRFHSSCVFGEALHALDCDCGEQLRSSLAVIVQEGGFIIYGWDEGRGLGIEKKIQAIALQETAGLTTAQAFAKLGHAAEPRDFRQYVTVLKEVFKGSKIRLASNNPQKISAVESAGFEIVERVPLIIELTSQRENYLKDKRAVLGHLNDNT